MAKSKRPTKGKIKTPPSKKAKTRRANNSSPKAKVKASSNSPAKTKVKSKDKSPFGKNLMKPMASSQDGKNPAAQGYGGRGKKMGQDPLKVAIISLASALVTGGGH